MQHLKFRLLSRAMMSLGAFYALSCSLPSLAAGDEPGILRAPISLSFVVIGGDAGIPFSAALLNLINTNGVLLAAEPVLSEDGVVSLLQRRYKLPSWVDLSPLVDGLCGMNPQACTVSKGKAFWHLNQGAPTLKAGPCGSQQKVSPGSSQGTYICVPDVTVTQDVSLIARRFSGPRDAEELPAVVTTLTRGCDQFDVSCQYLILDNNTRQLQSWAVAKQTLPKSPKSSSLPSKTTDWWKLLSGTVTIPAAYITVNLPVQKDYAALMRQCDSLKQSVSVADSAVRALRPYLRGKGSTGIILTRCGSKIRHAMGIGGSAEGLVSGLVISPDEFKKREQVWRKKMGWDETVKPAKDLIIGVWDGPLSISITGFKRPDWERLHLLRNDSGDDPSFPGGSAVAWLGPKQASSGERGACGSKTDGAPPLTDPTQHGNIVGSMLIGQGGLVPDVHIWSYRWDQDYLITPDSPSSKWMVLQTMVEEIVDTLAPIQEIPAIANLSCAPSLDDRGQDTHHSVFDFSQDLVRSVNRQNVDTVAYAIAVAAGNRDGTLYPTYPLQEDDARGYGALSRSPTTAGFISVVGLGPSGKDVLKCKDLRSLAHELAPSLASQPMAGGEPAYFAADCPMLDADGNQRDDNPIVLYGPAYDVEAIGMGGTSDGSSGNAFLTWGSSYAAPYVTALIADIYSETKRRGIAYVDASAKLVADRIRFTTDKSNLSKFGRINAARAFHFWDDQIELVHDDPARLTAGEIQEQQCSGRHDAQPQVGAGPFHLDVEDGGEPALKFHGPSKAGETIIFNEIVRLRRVKAPDSGPLFQAIYRSARTPCSNPRS